MYMLERKIVNNIVEEMRFFLERVEKRKFDIRAENGEHNSGKSRTRPDVEQITTRTDIPIMEQKSRVEKMFYPNFCRIRNGSEICMFVFCQKEYTIRLESVELFSRER